MRGCLCRQLQFPGGVAGCHNATGQVAKDYINPASWWCFAPDRDRFVPLQNHISGKDFVTPYDIAIATAKHFNLDASLIQKTDSTQFKQTAQRPLITGFDIRKAEKELGYQAHSLSEGIAIVANQIKPL